MSTFLYATISESHPSTSSSALVPVDAPQLSLPRVPRNGGAGPRSSPSLSGEEPPFKRPRTSWAAQAPSHVTGAMPQPSQLPPGQATPTPQSSKVYPLVHVPQGYSAEILSQPLTTTYLTSPFPPGPVPRASAGQNLSRTIPSVQPSQLDQLAGASQTTYTLASSTGYEEHNAPRTFPPNFPAALEMVRQNQRVMQAIAARRQAKRDLLHAHAQSRRLEAVQKLLDAEIAEEAKRAAVAMRILQVCHPTSQLYARAEGWIGRAMLSSYSSDHFARMMQRIESSVGPVGYSEVGPDTVNRSVPPQPAPSALVPTFLPPGDLPTGLSAEETAALIREASFLFE